MKRPGFRHLDLSILVGNSGIYDYEGFTSGHFFKALSLARELTHLNLTLALEDGGRNDLILPLKEILPVQQWPNLYHSGLFNFSINVSDVIGLLGSASSSMRSVELGSLRFPNSEGLWSGLLERMRDELGWSKRDQSLRPAVRITMDIDQMRPGRFALPTDEVMRFFYESGEIPTTRNIRNYPKLGMALCVIFLNLNTLDQTWVREHREMGIIL